MTLDIRKCLIPTNVRPADENPTIHGRVVAVDPCYVVNREMWQRFIDPIFAAEDKKGRYALVQFDVNGHTCYVASTNYGDGTYHPNGKIPMIGEVGVDAGMIALIPAEAFRGTEMAELAEMSEEDLLTTQFDNYAVLFLGDKDCEVGYEKGNWYLDVAEIITDGSDVEEDEEDEEDWGDEEEDEEDED